MNAAGLSRLFRQYIWESLQVSIFYTEEESTYSQTHPTDVFLGSWSLLSFVEAAQTAIFKNSANRGSDLTDTCLVLDSTLELPTKPSGNYLKLPLQNHANVLLDSFFTKVFHSS